MRTYEAPKAAQARSRGEPETAGVVLGVSLGVLMAAVIWLWLPR